MPLLMDLWTAALHNEYTGHKDPQSGLSKDCPRCREMATKLLDMQVEQLLEIDLMEDLTFTKERLAN